MEFYGSQAETYAVYLSNAIDAFILTLEHNQPPKVFVAYSKFVILNAHKLLCIGDTVHRNVVNAFQVVGKMLNLTFLTLSIGRDCRRAFRAPKRLAKSSQVLLPFKECSTLS